MSNVFQWKNLFKRMCTVNVLVCFVPKRTHTHTRANIFMEINKIGNHSKMQISKHYGIDI